MNLDKLSELLHNKEYQKKVSLEEIDQWIDMYPYMDQLRVIRANKMSAVNQDTTLMHEAAIYNGKVMDSDTQFHEFVNLEEVLNEEEVFVSITDTVAEDKETLQTTEEEELTSIVLDEDIQEIPVEEDEVTIQNAEGGGSSESEILEVAASMESILEENKVVEENLSLTIEDEVKESEVQETPISVSDQDLYIEEPEVTTDEGQIATGPSNIEMPDITIAEDEIESLENSDLVSMKSIKKKKKKKDSGKLLQVEGEVPKDAKKKKKKKDKKKDKKDKNKDKKKKDRKKGKSKKDKKADKSKSSDKKDKKTKKDVGKDGKMSSKKDKKAKSKKSKAKSSQSSYTEWLLSQKQVADKSKKKKKKKGKKKDKIVDKAMKSVMKKKAIVSEPLAELLALQGHTNQAIAMYKELSLIIPEKSAYFAEQIENLENNK